MQAVPQAQDSSAHSCLFNIQQSPCFDFQHEYVQNGPTDRIGGVVSDLYWGTYLDCETAIQNIHQYRLLKMLIICADKHWTEQNWTLKLFYSPWTELVRNPCSYHPYPVVKWDKRPAFYVSGFCSQKIHWFQSTSEYFYCVLLLTKTCFSILAENVKCDSSVLV